MKTYKPFTKQKKAHNSRASYVLYGGSIGSGKTAWLCNSAIMHAVKYPSARILLCRHQLVSFKRSTLQTLLEFLPSDLVRRHHKSEHYILFRNGSKIFYSGLGSETGDLDKLKSSEYSLVCIDQVEETTSAHFLMLVSRLRIHFKGYKNQLLATANPDSGWIRARWVDTRKPDHEFIQAVCAENIFLPAGYEERMRQVYPEDMARVLLDGDWDLIQDAASVFKYSDIERAMINEKASDKGPLCFGVDIARYGTSESVICKLAGSVCTFPDIFGKVSLMETAGKIVQAIDRNKEVKVKCDMVGLGAGTGDRCIELGYNIYEYRGSAKADDPKKFKNKRAQDYFNLASLLKTLKIPNDPKLRSEMVGMRYFILSDGLIQCESKDSMSKRGLPSPDRLDALVIACSGEGESEYSRDDRPFLVSLGIEYEPTKEELDRDENESWAQMGSGPTIIGSRDVVREALSEVRVKKYPNSGHSMGMAATKKKKSPRELHSE